jgi:hypothetical protein
MKVCPSCKYSNREGVLFCDDCGDPLVNVPSPATTKLNAEKLEAVSPVIQPVVFGTARFARDAKVMLRIRDSEDQVELSKSEETTVGRADPVTGNTPGLDLTPFGAQEKGVSRTHAIIKRGDETLTLTDLGSVNGTHLNGQRLVPNQPRVLRDGDEIRLGKLTMHVYFKG